MAVSCQPAGSSGKKEKAIRRVANICFNLKPRQPVYIEKRICSKKRG